MPSPDAERPPNHADSDIHTSLLQTTDPPRLCPPMTPSLAGTAYKAVVALLLLWAPVARSQEPDFVAKIDIPVRSSSSSCAVNGKYYTGTFYEVAGIVITKTDIALFTYESKTTITNSTI